MKYEQKTIRSETRFGFTLTEMLVAVALTLIIMLMFAQIYSTALGTMGQQQGLAQNDQKARVVTSVIHNDLQNMTYRQASSTYGNTPGIVALAIGDEPIIDPVNQRGYFYYSENVQNDDTDDIIQFTTQVAVGERGDAFSKDVNLPYTGKAGDLGVASEPEQDDGDAGEDSRSRFAEISYFLRKGILYRRVLLIREPIARTLPLGSQPVTGNGTNRRFDQLNPSYGGEFYQNFDFSATRRFYATPLDLENDSFLWFHSTDSLDNTKGLTNTPLGDPSTRFGFIPRTLANAGNSLEYDNQATPKWIGRFTMQETCHGDFDYPGTVPVVALNPYGRTDLQVNTSGVVNQYVGTSRVGEDILLTNVEAFDVEYLGSVTGATFVDAPAGQGFDTSHPNIPASVTKQDDGTFFKQPALTTWTPNATVSGALYTSCSSLSGNHLSRQSMYYELIVPGDTGDRPPEFPPIPGTIVQDGTARWRCVDNRIGLKGLRITVRYRDTTSSMPRQVTIVHSFVE